MDLTIVIVSFNTRELLACCLESVCADLERSRLEGEVWVVDNGSADGSAEMVRQRFPTVRLLALGENVGFAAANNRALRGISLLQSPIPPAVLLLNPDTAVQPRALETLLEFMAVCPRAGAAGAALRYPDGAFQHSAFAFPTLAQVFLDFFPLNHRLLNSRINGRYPRAWYEHGEPFPVDHPLGAAILVRSQALQEVGLLDEGFFMYCEEIDWCWRARKAGWEVYCVPRAVVIHHEAQSTRQFRDEMFVQLWHSRFQLFARHRGALYTGLMRWVLRLGLRVETRQMRRAFQAGWISRGELESRLAAYRRVGRM